jgi:thiol-disulfide isomerase/thioredoxin
MASKAKRLRTARRAQSPAIRRRGNWWIIGGGIAGAVALLAGLTVVLSGPEVTGGEGTTGLATAPARLDFPVALYQGEDVLGSSQLEFADLLGGRPIVLNYWASNCPPCKAEMPGFQRVWESYSDRVLFFGLDIGRFAGFGGPEVSMEQLSSLGVTYPAAPVPDLRTLQRLRVQGLPTTEFITPDGEVTRSWTGMLNEARLTEMIEDLLVAN